MSCKGCRWINTVIILNPFFDCTDKEFVPRKFKINLRNENLNLLISKLEKQLIVSAFVMLKEMNISPAQYDVFVRNKEHCEMLKDCADVLKNVGKQKYVKWLGRDATND